MDIWKRARAVAEGAVKTGLQALEGDAPPVTDDVHFNESSATPSKSNEASGKLKIDTAALREATKEQLLDVIDKVFQKFFLYFNKYKKFMFVARSGFVSRSNCYI